MTDQYQLMLQMTAEDDPPAPPDSANDFPIQVQTEIWAAELSFGDPNEWSGPAQWGFEHHKNSESTCIGYSPMWEAGYLAREIQTHDDRAKRDSNAWPWDPARPVEGQYEEWLVARRSVFHTGQFVRSRARQVLARLSRLEREVKLLISEVKFIENLGRDQTQLEKKRSFRKDRHKVRF